VTRQRAQRAKEKVPADGPGPSLSTLMMGLVLRDHRAAEGVVHADGANIDILADAIDGRKGAGARVGGDIAAAHEEMVVFEGDRPMRREADFDASAHGAAPTGFAGAVEQRDRRRVSPILCSGPDRSGTK
jgi:hypothetical protein